jgi:plastocyanin
MHLRRAAVAALAFSTLFGLAACNKNDTGNNTLVGRKSPSPASSGGPQTTAPAEAGGGPVALAAKDNEFDPKAITAKAGAVTIEMKNNGVSPHTFTSTDLGVDVNVDAGKTGTIQIADAKPGTYKFVCKYHESLGMTGELTVT